MEKMKNREAEYYLQASVLNRLFGNSKFRKKRLNRALNQKRIALLITGSNCQTAC